MYGWRAKIGRISPSPETVGAEEWRRSMPNGVCLVETRTLVHDVTMEGLAEAVTQVERAALELASAEVDVILQAGTAIAFFRGLGHDIELSRRITAATGIKATTSLTAIVEALRALGIKKPAVATSYIADIDGRLVEVLEKIRIPGRRYQGHGNQEKRRYGQSGAQGNLSFGEASRALCAWSRRHFNLLRQSAQLRSD